MARTKRLIASGLACFALLLLGPTFLFLAMAVYLVDGRPVVVQEDWTDRRGRSITLLAFRTTQVRSNIHDDRMLLPCVGWYLQRSSLDKLPMWWNMLKCDCDLEAMWH
jgi:lipopolysaccharide/colanic/teichoic acid biosynthesis glycosyltransferase